jgi:hypothetical protein
MSIDFNDCLYLNAETDNAESMLKKCINGSDDLSWPCIGNELMDKDIFDLVTERPQGDNVQGPLNHSLHVDSHSQKKDILFENTNDSNVEGFTNMGEKYIKPGDFPDGYFRCPKTGKIKQVCMNCKYNQRTYGKSKEFNEADPCFPNRGVYNGITNQGQTKCSCGQRGQYCREVFNAQGGMFADNVFIMNVGDFGPLGKLASY